MRIAEKAIEKHSPIISIGAGRSGSTLLGRMLGSHPDIEFSYYETDFVLIRLWNAIFGNHNEPHLLASIKLQVANQNNISNGKSSFGFKNKEAEMAKIIADSLKRIHEIPSDVKLWGFKEIWNGSGNNIHPWNCYDKIFPNAVYIHLIRDPFEFALSNANFSGELNERFIVERLQDWVAMYHHNRRRKDTERYFEVRYEDLLLNSQETLQPFFDFIGLPWNEAVLEARINKKFVPSKTRDKEQELDFLQRYNWRIHGLYQLCEKLGYSENISARKIPVASNNDSPPETNIINSNKIKQQTGYCYSVILPDEDRLFLYELYEDEQPLFFFTNNHQLIKSVGGGSHCVWKNLQKNRQLLFFSSSDNSDPRTNNRVYSLRNHHQDSSMNTDVIIRTIGEQAI